MKISIKTTTRQFKRNAPHTHTRTQNIKRTYTITSWQTRRMLLHVKNKKTNLYIYIYKPIRNVNKTEHPHTKTCKKITKNTTCKILFANNARSLMNQKNSMCHAKSALKKSLTKQTSFSIEIDRTHVHRKTNSKQTTWEILLGGNGRSLLYRRNNNLWHVTVRKSHMFWFYPSCMSSEINRTHMLKHKRKTKTTYKITLGGNSRTRLADKTSCV